MDQELVLQPGPPQAQIPGAFPWGWALALSPPPDGIGVGRGSTRVPEPIGLTEDVIGVLDRLLARLCDQLKAAGQGGAETPAGIAARQPLRGCRDGTFAS